MAQIIVRNRVDASWSAFSTSIARLSGQEMGGERTQKFHLEDDPTACQIVSKLDKSILAKTGAIEG